MTLPDDIRRFRENSYGWMIQRIAGKLDRAMEARLSPLGLNLKQFAVLMTALEKCGQTQTEIGAQFGMPAYAISRALDHLEREGLITRQAHPTSRRTFKISPTAAGEALAPELCNIVKEVNVELLADVPESQHEALRSLLKQLM